jgi:hypothetical protein
MFYILESNGILAVLQIEISSAHWPSGYSQGKSKSDKGSAHFVEG